MSAQDPGFPAYGFTDLLKIAGFASQTMLWENRRQPAPEQKPIGQYWSGHAWVVLYKATDAVDRPPLSPGRQRQYDKARTCAGCGAKSKSPWSKFRDGERYCTPCMKPAAERLWQREREADWPAVIEWARGVLADPTSVIAIQERHQFWTCELVVDLDGNVLLDAEIRYYLREPERDNEHAEQLRARSPLAVMGHVEALRGRRLISWWPNTAPDLVTSWNERGHPVDHAAHVAQTDAMGRWYDRWVGDLAPGSSYLSPSPWLKSHNGPEGDLRKRAAQMRQILTEMASGEHRAATAPNPSEVPGA